MPPGFPSVDELARAGALITGVYRREADLLHTEGRQWRINLAFIGAGFVVMAIVIVALFHAVDSDAATGVGVPIAGAAMFLSLIGLTLNFGPSVRFFRHLGYRPDELAELVGYIEAGLDRERVRTTELGKWAVEIYLAWNEIQDYRETAA